MFHMLHDLVVILYLSHYYHFAMLQDVRNLCCIHRFPNTIHNNKQETYTVENVAHACFSNNGNDDIDDAYVYEMKCN